jgi:hypothetical protein
LRLHTSATPHETSHKTDHPAGESSNQAGASSSLRE